MPARHASIRCSAAQRSTAANAAGHRRQTRHKQLQDCMLAWHTTTAPKTSEGMEQLAQILVRLARAGGGVHRFTVAAQGRWRRQPDAKRGQPPTLLASTQHARSKAPCWVAKPPLIPSTSLSRATPLTAEVSFNHITHTSLSTLTQAPHAAHLGTHTAHVSCNKPMPRAHSCTRKRPAYVRVCRKII